MKGYSLNELMLFERVTNVQDAIEDENEQDHF